MVGTLYMVATPIGNLEDLSDRAKSTLTGVDLVFAEDTRVTGRMLKHLGIETPVKRYDHHSHVSQSKVVLEALASGSSVAYVSDAGTPGVEDPGGRLVEVVADTMPEVRVVPISGPSAVMTLLSVSGFPADKFTVMGFPPKKKGRQAYFDALAETSGTVVLYESTHRILKTLEEMSSRQPERRAVVGRELTKKFETIVRGTLKEVLAQLSTESTKGEFMIVVA